MLDIKPIEFLLRALPESFLVIIAIYLFSKTDINLSNYRITSIVFSIIWYITRKLPISYGVHMILSVILLQFIVVFYNKIDAIKGIKGIIYIYLIQLISELFNILILKLLNIELELLLTDPLYKTILGLPSIITTGIITFLYYVISKKRKK